MATPTVKKIEKTAEEIHRTILKRQKPKLRFPLRSLSNVKYDPKAGHFEMRGRKKERTLTVSTVKTFEQPESDAVMDDVEALFQVNREQIGFAPEEKGGEISGRLIIVDRDSETGKPLRIDCTKFGSGAYSIPISVEHLKFQTDAGFILVIETAGMFQRLVKHKYWKTANCVLVSMGGVPTSAYRRFIRRLADFKKIPVYVFVDGDPYGISNIYRTLKVGSGNAAHLNEYFCVPQARYLGITTQDIVDYKLPTHPLKDVDVKRARDAIKNDPFFQHHKPWVDAMEHLLKMGVRAEQQALAKWGLNYVIDTYLPEKLKQPEKFLP